MTRALPFTQAGLQRAIRAARNAGLRVIGIRPDGTLIVNDGDSPAPEVAHFKCEVDTAAPSRWGDVQA